MDLFKTASHGGGFKIDSFYSSQWLLFPHFTAAGFKYPRYICLGSLNCEFMKGQLQQRLCLVHLMAPLKVL